VREVLDDYGARTRAALEQYLPRREPRQYLYDIVADYPNRGGKLMRPCICMATAAALGGQASDALLCAVSLELLHNALLIHDDIEDESSERRGRPTLHALHGIPIAVNAGDALTLLSLRPLFDNRASLGADLTFRLVQETELVATESAEGQALELGWRIDNRLDITESDYMTMVMKKTCWLATIYPLRSGALIGTRGRVDPNRFTTFGFFLGTAFQIQDDLLNLVADERYGKERDGDLWEGKRTLMLIHLLDACTADERARIEATLGQARADKDPAEVRWMRAAMDRYGSLDYGREVANGIAGAAVEEFHKAFEGARPSRDLAFLEGLATWVFERG
jgi:geranylgeranyl diphosphate synthase type II